MTVPVLTSILPNSGPSGGGDLVRLSGSGFAPSVEVSFGQSPATVLHVVALEQTNFVEVRTPAHPAGLVDVTVSNLEAGGICIPGEVALLSAAYHFVRPALCEEALLTRLVRAILRELKQQVLDNVNASVALDYDDTPGDGLNVTALATLPSLVLSGPRLRENRFYSSNLLAEEFSNQEIQRTRPPYTVDLLFTLTAASSRTVELLNLLTATAACLHRTRWLCLAKVPDDLSKGLVRWELDPEGELKTRLDTEVRVFTWGLIVRGVDLVQGLPSDRSKPVQDLCCTTYGVVA